MANSEKEIREDAASHQSESPASDSEAGGPVINERALLRKIDAYLLPVVGVLYLLSFLDRSNVGNAKLDGLLDDLHMTGAQYLNGLSLFFVGYVLFEIPCNVMLRRTSPRIWLPTLTIVWGIVATLTGIVQNQSGFLAVRFFLGLAEAGLFPGTTFYFTMWYKRRERQYRVALFFSAAALAGAFGGALAYAIGKLAGTVFTNGWHWIFIIEGILTVVVAAMAYGFIHNYPDTAKFLNDDERKFIRQRLAADSDATHDEKFRWGAVLEALLDPKIWLYGLGFHTLALPLYTLSLFLPTIIAELGYKAAIAQLLTVPPYAFAFGTTLTAAIISERLKSRAVFIAGSSLFGAVGYILLLANTDPVARPGISYVGVFFAAGGIYPGVALVLSWPCINVSGQTKRATSTAMQVSIGIVGAVFGVQLYRSNDGPRYILGHSFALGYLVLNAVIVGILAYVLRKENKRREAIAVEVKEVGSLEDWEGDKDPRWRFEY
ncbi:major facilitator superfamily domain-containing protein [Xylariaceae sp. FL0255]|nr:major facilitator superfamily domain-containing protein [Xylariaceae sp. FL0255]